MAGAGGTRRGGVIYELIPKGAYVKVSAIDEATGVEVSIVGDARVTQADLERIALRKLDRALDQKSEQKKR